MIEVFEPVDAHDRRLVRRAGGLLAAFNAAGVLTAADVHVAARVSALVGEGDESAALAVALAVRAVRTGSVCVDLAAVAGGVPGGSGLPWPETGGWLERVTGGPLGARSVVRAEHGLLYLDRYWREEGQVRDDLLARAAAAPPPVVAEVLQASARRLFPGSGYDEQRSAAVAAAGQWTTVLTGGPGTGKTTTVAGLLALLAEQTELTGGRARVALAAPTAKAAARLQQAVSEALAEDRFTEDDRARVGQVRAATLHRLLGSRPDTRTRFRRHRGNRLPHDVVVVDETSMVSLTMMSRLLEAVRADARLVLVGDADQLSSVEAGAVLADLVGGLTAAGGSTVTALRTEHRFGAGIGALAAALRLGEADAVLALLAEGGEDVEFLPLAEGAGEVSGPGHVLGEQVTSRLREVLLRTALRVRAAAVDGDAAAAVAAMEAHRLLCAHREGPFGVGWWNAAVERWLTDRLGEPVGQARGQEWYPGRPLLVTANDYGLELFNGDTGVVVGDGGDRLRAVIAGVGAHRGLALSRLGEVETMHAMTIHKAQGSQADEVTVLLPPPDSPLLTRELFYTAVTRAQRKVRVVGSPASVRAAVERRAQRASGLRLRLATP